MPTEYSGVDIARGASVVVVALLTLVLLAILPQPGYRTSRLVPFALVILVGWGGALGAIYERVPLTLGGAIGIFLLGFWQFTIGLAMLPTSAVLLITALLMWDAADAENALTR